MKQLTLQFSSPAGFKDSLPRSDTLFGALCWGIRLLYDNQRLLDFLATYQQGKPAVLLSSAFPYVAGDSRTHYCFPRPRSAPHLMPDDPKSLSLFKKFTQARFVDDQLLQQIIDNGFGDTELWAKFVDRSLFLSETGLVLSSEPIPSVQLRSEAVPGNVIDRLAGGTIEGGLYHTTEWFFGDKTGAFALVHLAEEWERQVLAVFRYYADKGIGGDSSVGKGSYELAIQQGFPFKESASGTRWTTLSLYYPRPDEWSYYQASPEQVWYSLVKRKGRLESSFSPAADVWKKSVLMLEEGSCFPVLEGRNVYGELPEVKVLPDGVRVLQYGLGFPIRME